MPTRTFFNLPEPKRQKLLEAIYAEFSRAPYDEVSINRIIRAAGISRGSFYQYFENKQDVLEYLLSQHRHGMEQRALQSLRENGGDLFAMFLDLLDFTFASISREGGGAFFRNVLADVRYNTHLFVAQDRAAQGGFSQRLLDGLDTSRLDIRAPGELENMLGVLVSITGEAFARAFFDASGYEAVRAQYAARLELIKRGFRLQKAAP